MNEEDPSLFERSFKILRSPIRIISRSETDLNKIQTRAKTKRQEETSKTVRQTPTRFSETDIGSPVTPSTSKEIEIESPNNIITGTPEPETGNNHKIAAGKQTKASEQTPKVKTVAPKPQTLRNVNMATNMTPLQMQQLISTAISEFSGEDNPKRENELNRFIATADSIYNSLASQEERNIFNRLIKLKLTDEAFNRITSRTLETYPETKQVLKDMYKEINSLEDLERKYTEIKQGYGESIRSYGFRLLEALEKYKKGYRNKYNTQNIDPTYEKHLQTNSVKTFKRGLNNTILKDKIATSTATNIEGIIKETEIIEKMLLDTNIPVETNQTTIQTTQLTSIPTYTQPTVICNHCQKPYYTYGKCRNRIANEASKPHQNAPTQNN